MERKKRRVDSSQGGLQGQGRVGETQSTLQARRLQGLACTAQRNKGWKGKWFPPINTWGWEEVELGGRKKNIAINWSWTCLGLKKPSQFWENVHWSAGIELLEEIQGKQTQNHPMAEPDNSVKDDRICAGRELHKSAGPTLLLPENVVKLQSWQGEVCNSNSIINQVFDIWMPQFQTNSIQDETPHLKPTLS